MKMKSLMTMMAAVVMVMGVSSCGGDDSNDGTVDVAQVVGSYLGEEVVFVDNEESSRETQTYKFTKGADGTIDMVIPSVGMGMMTIPSVTVKGISLSKDGNIIKGSLAQYEGTVGDKAFTVSDITILFSGNIVTVKFSEKYGKMPFTLETTFSGIKE